MPNTPSGLPYPAESDPVAQGAGAIRALAEAIPCIQTGQVSIPMNSSLWAEETVTFPIPYASVPSVVVSVAGGSVAHFAITGSLTATRVSIRAVYRDDSSPSNPTVLVSWIAVGDAK